MLRVLAREHTRRSSRDSQRGPRKSSKTMGTVHLWKDHFLKKDENDITFCTKSVKISFVSSQVILFSPNRKIYHC